MKNKNIKYIGIGIAVLMLIGVGIYMVKNVFPDFNAAREITNALQPFLDAENKSMHLVMDAEVGEKEFQLETEIAIVKEETTDYLIMKQENTSFYVVDNLLLLENGKAFLLTEEKTDAQEQTMTYIDMLPLLAVAFDEFEIKRTEENEKIYYQIEVSGAQMKQILEATMPSREEIGDAVKCLQVQLLTQNGNLDEIQIKGAGASEETQVSLSVTISNFTLLTEGECKIPQVVKAAIGNVERENLFCLTEDLYRLIKAVEPLEDMSKLQGIINWQVSCGLIQINTSIDMEKLHALQKEEGDVEGVSPDEEEKTDESETASKLIGVVGTMIMEGEISCRQQDEMYVYELVLDEVAMKQLVETMAPEIVSYAVDFEKGSMKIGINDQQLSEIMIGIEGGFNALFTKVPVRVSVAFDFE